MLAVTIGLGRVGWILGVGVGVGTWALFSKAIRRHRMTALGPANQITLARAVLVGGVTALVSDSLVATVRVPVLVPVLVGLTLVALLLDAFDGQIARRTGTMSTLGARFDMEVDAFLIFVLSVFLTTELGWWVVAIGAMRYAFVVTARFLPWLTAPLPPRFSRKVVAAVQGIVLVVASSGILPGQLATWSAAIALALLCWSFGRDINWLSEAKRRTTSAA
jgi:phosphatidylglycerophosphate synthase